MKVTTKMRLTVDRLAEEKKISIGAAARELLEAGIHAKGLAEND